MELINSKKAIEKYLMYRKSGDNKKQNLENFETSLKKIFETKKDFRELVEESIKATAFSNYKALLLKDLFKERLALAYYDDFNLRP